MDDVVRRYRAAVAGGRLTEFSLRGYDRTGVPVVATVWDHDGRDAHGVGYGRTERAAQIGALGELAERVVLGRTLRRAPVRRATYAALRAEVGADAVADPLTLVLPAGSVYGAERPLDWMPMQRWRTGETVLVPAEFVASDNDSLPAAPPAGGWLSTAITNGLGAGDTVERAVGHGLLELLQRDGDTVSFRAMDTGVVVDLDASTDPETREIVAGFRAVGIEPVVKLASTEFVNVVYCLGRDEHPDTPPMAIGAMGEAAHPDRDVAIRKSLLEYASSRARRVFAFGPLDRVRELSPEYLRDELQRPLGEQEARALREMTAWSDWNADRMREVLRPYLERHERTVSPAELAATGELGPETLLAELLDRLHDFDVLVAVSDPADGAGVIHAAKVVVPGLEVETLSYLRIGERVTRRLLDRGSPLVGRGEPDRPARRPVRLSAAARERLGGPAWLDTAAVEATLGPLYPLYREPRRHAVARSRGA